MIVIYFSEQFVIIIPDYPKNDFVQVQIFQMNGRTDSADQPVSSLGVHSHLEFTYDVQ